MQHFSIFSIEWHTPIWLEIFTKKNGEREEKAVFDVLSKTNILRIILVLIICFQWNMEQLSKTKIIYGRRPCQWKESQYQFKIIPVLVVSGTFRFLPLPDFCTKNSALKRHIEKKAAAAAGSGRHPGTTGSCLAAAVGTEVWGGKEAALGAGTAHML